MDDLSLTPSSEDPLRILAPGQKKLTTIESQRVLAVMEEAIKRVEGATVIPILANSLERFSVSLGTEMVKQLKEYTHLTSEYTRIYTDLEQQGVTPELSECDEALDTPPLDDSLHSQSTITSSGRPVRLEPIEAAEEKPNATELEFQQVRSRLKHNIKCILRDLHRNSLPSSVQGSIASFGGGERKNDQFVTRRDVVSNTQPPSVHLVSGHISSTNLLYSLSYNCEKEEMPHYYIGSSA